MSLETSVLIDMVFVVIFAIFAFHASFKGNYAKAAYFLLFALWSMEGSRWRVTDHKIDLALKAVGVEVKP